MKLKILLIILTIETINSNKYYNKHMLTNNQNKINTKTNFKFKISRTNNLLKCNLIKFFKINSVIKINNRIIKINNILMKKIYNITKNIRNNKKRSKMKCSSYLMKTSIIKLKIVHKKNFSINMLMNSNI